MPIGSLKPHPTLAVVGFLLASACGTGGEPAQPPGAVSAADVQEFDGDASGSARCGPYSVEWQSPELGDEGPPATLTVRDGEAALLEVVGRDETEQLVPLWCGDVTGDGSLELGHQAFTGGAHCCFRARVDTLGGSRLLDVDLGNAGGPKPEQLDGQGALEIVTFSDALAYFDDLPFVASPFLPRVFAFRTGAYVEATGEFPDHVRESIDEALDFIDEMVAREEPFEAVAGAALGAFGHYVLLGEEPEGLDEVVSRVPTDVADWLRERAGRAAEVVRDAGSPE